MTTRSFRIADETWSEVQARSDEEGVSTSQFVKQAIFEKLSGTGEARVAADLERLREEFREYRRQFAGAVKALLILVGSHKELDRETAEEWVTKNLTVP